MAAAIDDSRRGDQGLANLRLAMTKHTRIADAQDWSARRAAAERCLANGITAKELLRELDPDRVSDKDLLKFDPGQPRVPAGSGRESGRWTRAIRSALAAVARRAAPLLAASLGAETLAALSTFASTAGFAATLGLLFVPSPNSISSSGPLPGDTENTYSYNHDEGLLRVLGPSGVVLAAGRKDGVGLFLDENTGVPFAREVDGALVFDSASLAAVGSVNFSPSPSNVVPAAAAAAAVPQEEEDENEEEPKLCPDPGLDQPGALSASARAQAYQEQISFMINPQRPLPFGLSMNLINPLTGKTVHYDECDEQTGTMIDAKGPGFNGLLTFPAAYENVTDKWVTQGRSQVQAAGSRRITWYFAEDRAASVARSVLAENGLGKITVIYQP